MRESFFPHTFFCCLIAAPTTFRPLSRMLLQPCAVENDAPDFLFPAVECFIYPKGFNQLASLLCRQASRSGRRPRRTLSVTSPTAPASRMPAGELEVADSVDGDVLVCVCTAGMKAWRMVHLHNTRLDGRACMFAWRSVNGCDRCGLLCQG